MRAERSRPQERLLVLIGPGGAFLRKERTGSAVSASGQGPCFSFRSTRRTPACPQRWPAPPRCRPGGVARGRPRRSAEASRDDGGLLRDPSLLWPWPDESFYSCPQICFTVLFCHSPGPQALVGSPVGQRDGWERTTLGMCVPSSRARRRTSWACASFSRRVLEVALVLSPLCE